MRNSVVLYFGSGVRALCILGMLIAVGTAGLESWKARAQTSRVFRVISTTAQQGQQVTVSVEIDAQGNELAVSFSLHYDPSILSNPVSTLGPGYAPGTLLSTGPGFGPAGRLGVVVEAPSPSSPFPSGTRQLMRTTFNVAANAPSGATAIIFADQPTSRGVAIINGALSPAVFQPGTITIGSGPQPSPTPTATATPVASPTPTPVASPTPTPVASPTPTPTPVASPTPTPTPVASPTPTPTPVATPTPTPTPSPTPSPSPTPTPGPSPTPNTPAGTNVLVTAPGGFINATFGTVFQAGTTTFSSISGGSAGFPPAGYTILNGGPHTRITTTAFYAAPVTVCFKVFGVDDADEFAKLRILHREGSLLIDRTIFPPGSPAPDFGLRQVCAQVEVASDFYITFGPTFNVSGRVLTPSGQGLRNASVTMVDYRGVRRTSVTSSFGVYTFEGVRAGEPITINVSSRRYRFSSVSLVVSADIGVLDFTGLE